MSLTQQKRLYEAERCLWGHGREFSSNTEVVAYLNDIMSMSWFIKQYGWMPSILVASFNSTKWAGAADTKNFRIHLNKRIESVVLHELSHLLCSTDDHDEDFTNIYLHLVRNAMGFYAWAEFSYELEKKEYYNA